MFRPLGIAIAALALAGCQLNLPWRADKAPDAPAGYERFFSPAPHNFRFGDISLGDPVRRGTHSERFELRDGDCGGSDCGNPRYRAEIRQLEQANPARIGKDIWYGWSFHNINLRSYDRKDTLRLVFGQWTMGGAANPAIRLIQLGQGEGHWSTCNPAICAGPEKTRGDVVIQLEDMRRTRDWGKAENNGYICRLFDLAANRGRWVDIVINTNFSSGSDGYVRAWVNGEQKCDYSGPVTSTASLAQGALPEHRRGVFSSYTTRWDETHGAQTKPRIIVYYDEFRTGATRLDVDVRLRQEGGLSPVD